MSSLACARSTFFPRNYIPIKSDVERHKSADFQRLQTKSVILGISVVYVSNVLLVHIISPSSCLSLSHLSPEIFILSYYLFTSSYLSPTPKLLGPHTPPPTYGDYPKTFLRYNEYMSFSTWVFLSLSVFYTPPPF